MTLMNSELSSYPPLVFLNYGHMSECTQNANLANIIEVEANGVTCNFSAEERASLVSSVGSMVAPLTGWYWV